MAVVQTADLDILPAPAWQKRADLSTEKSAKTTTRSIHPAKSTARLPAWMSNGWLKPRMSTDCRTNASPGSRPDSCIV